MRRSHPFYRFITQKLQEFLWSLNFLHQKLSLWEKFSVLFLILSIFSFFLSWALLGNESNNNVESHLSVWAFSPLLWNIAFFLTPICVLGLYKILSIGRKQKKTSISFLQGQNSKIIFWIAIVLLLSSLHCYFSIRWMSYFNASVTHSIWLILSITSAIMLIGSSYILKSEEGTWVAWSFIGEREKKKSYQDSQTEENMKLPV